MEKLKQRITTKATKVKRYGNRIKQFQDNRNFETNQERFFKNLEDKEERTKPPNAEDATGPHIKANRGLTEINRAN